MRRWILYTAAAAVLLVLAPVEKTDIGELQPVELLYVSFENGEVRLETDTEDEGRGADLTAALEDLKATALGSVFLETADYLVMTREALPLLPELGTLLRPGTEVFLGDGADAGAAEFLRAHSPGITLNQLRRGKSEIPVLYKREGRYRIESAAKQ